MSGRARVATNNWISAIEGSDRITLDSAGYPWVIAGDDSIWQRTSKDPAVGTWIFHPGAAVDLAASGTCATTPGASNTCRVWAVGTDGVVYLRNLQSADTSAAAVDTWQAFNQQGSNIAAGEIGATLSREKRQRIHAHRQIGEQISIAGILYFSTAKPRANGTQLRFQKKIR